MLTVHATYTEGELENLLGVLSDYEPVSERALRWPPSQKLKLAQDVIRRINHPGLAELLELLPEIATLFEKRNDFIHGGIFAGIDGPHRLYRNGKERHITADEVYALASQFLYAWERLFNIHTFAVREALGRGHGT